MSNLKHTPTPWKVNEKYNTITDSDGCGIAQENGINNSQEWEANAKLIVKAVNCHEELLEALIEAKSLIKRQGFTEEHLTVIQITNAIKKATE